MGRYYSVVRDTVGNVVPNPIVTVYDANTTTLASIFTDEDLSSAAANPLTGNSDGSFEFFANSIERYKIVVSKAGFNTSTEDYVDIYGARDSRLYAPVEIESSGSVDVFSTYNTYQTKYIIRATGVTLVLPDPTAGGNQRARWIGTEGIVVINAHASASATIDIEGTGRDFWEQGATYSTLTLFAGETIILVCRTNSDPADQAWYVLNRY